MLSLRIYKFFLNYIFNMRVRLEKKRMLERKKEINVVVKKKYRKEFKYAQKQISGNISSSSSFSNMVYENNKTTNNSSITIINNNTSKTDYHALTIKFNKRNANKKADHENSSQNYKSNCFDENFLLLQMSMSSNNIEEQQIDAAVNHQRFDENCRLTTIEEESFTCPQCFRTYRRHGTLRRHLRQECGKGKSMVCSVCGHRTKRADHLRQHVRKKHPDVAMRSTFRQASNDTLPLYSSTASTLIADSTKSNMQLEKSVMQTVTTSVSVNKINNTNDYDDGDNNDVDDLTVENDAVAENLFVESGSIDQKYKDVFRATLFQHLQQLEQNSKT